MTDPLPAPPAVDPPRASSSGRDAALGGGGLTARPQAGQFNSLQVFRGVAAMWVAMFHVGVMSTLKLNVPFMNGAFDAGRLGVDFFFVLSGFIITCVHRVDIGVPAASKRFVLKRFYRVYPLLFVAMSIKVALLPLSQGSVRTPLPSFSTLFSSYLLLPESEQPILSVAWTLRHEVFFYLVFLFLIILGARAGRWLLGLWTLGILVGNWPFPTRSLDTLPAFVLSAYNLQFLLGCLIVYLVKNMPFSKQAAWAFLVAGLAGWGIGWYYAKAIFAWPELFCRLFWASVFGMTILGATWLEEKKTFAFPALLRRLGDASYSIYLFHLPTQTVLLILFLKLRVPDALGVQSALAMIGVLSIAIGLLAWRLVERPLLRMTPKG